MFKVYIDPGHGGYDSGAVGVRNVLEKDIVLEVAKKLEAKLRACGMEVKMSRSTDVFRSLSERTNEANKWGADVFVSIHCNSFNKSSKGLETYCYKFKYRKLADKVHSRIVEAGLYTKDRGVKEGNLHVIRESNMSACLVELAFIDQVDDVQLLLNKQEEFATAIAKGVCDYAGMRYVGNSTPSAPSAGKLYWRVVVDSNQDRSLSVATMEKAKSLGFGETFLAAYYKEGDSKPYYRVIVESTPDKNEAIAIKDKAIAKGFKGTFLATYIKE